MGTWLGIGGLGLGIDRVRIGWGWIGIDRMGFGLGLGSRLQLLGGSWPGLGPCKPIYLSVYPPNLCWPVLSCPAIPMLAGTHWHSPRTPGQG